MSRSRSNVERAVDREFVEHIANSHVEQGGFEGEQAARVRALALGFWAALEKGLSLGERFYLDAFRPADSPNSEYYVEKTARGLVLKQIDHLSKQ